jgi:NAD(P)-dependent dehydrogenase (short-subunit alcohol dehydrogenase family)
MAGKLDGKVAIVTAGGAGIGAATVRRFAREGAAVVIADLSGTRAQAVTAEVKSAGGRAVWIKMDASDPEAIQATIKLAIDSFGRLDVMFNNAGMAEVALVHDTTLESWNRVMAVTLTSTFLGIKYSVPIMRQQGGGAIVNTATFASTVYVPAASTPASLRSSVAIAPTNSAATWLRCIPSAAWANPKRSRTP